MFLVSTSKQLSAVLFVTAARVLYTNELFHDVSYSSVAPDG